MFLEALTEHQLHIFGGILILAVLVFGMLGVLIYLDKRGVKTYSSNQKKPTRRQRRLEKKPGKTKRRKK
jgi:hypothetical protein